MRDPNHPALWLWNLSPRAWKLWIAARSRKYRLGRELFELRTWWEYGRHITPEEWLEVGMVPKWKWLKSGPYVRKEKS